MKIKLPTIRHDQAGFQTLAYLAADSESLEHEVLEIDMSYTNWFDADMCASFGAILYRANWNLNEIILSNPPPDVERVLSKNGFLSHYGRESVTDVWGTTIAYKIFDTADSQHFAEYLDRDFLQRQQIPTMTDALKKRFHKSIFEIFSNAVLHSRTKLGIFSCGQYYPRGNRLDFSVADLGVGIQKNVEKHLGSPVSPEDAIAWATRDRNTTKRGPIPGGLGLKLLREFIDQNGGSIQIVSDAGYWRRSEKKTHMAKLTHSFPGTVVTIEINTADTKSYMLTSERPPADTNQE